MSEPAREIPPDGPPVPYEVIHLGGQAAAVVPLDELRRLKARDLRGCGPFAEATPAEVRAAIPPEDVGQFDSQWREATSAAVESRDLTAVFAMLDAWRRIAWSYTDDPGAHRRMLENAARLLAGEDIPTVPWEQTKARLGL